ncbi:MAG: phosphate ABC transporter substrate-binding protein [Candidatus Omnitrophica bacterium]|nr:phosphate ABC transporter substrate-binding protein [Candidatus Omnitrophota bacterium]
MAKKALLAVCIFLFLGAGTVGAEISYAGSSTIGENIMPKARQVFVQETGDKFDSIENVGSGKGLDALTEGRVNLTGVSRPLFPGEKARGFYYQIIGYDAIAIFVHKKNPVRNLTKEQVKNIFTGRTKNWKEVGGNDAPIVCITETWGNKRATMIEFQKLALGGLDYCPDRKEVDEPKDQVEMLAAEENGIVFASAAFSRLEIKAVSINNIAPLAENIFSGVYLFSRPLFLVTRGYPKGDLKRFFDFILSQKGQQIVAEHFVPVRRDIREEGE